MFNRDDFPMLRQPVVYLDSAATSLKPQCVIDAISTFYSDYYGTVHRAVYQLSSRATTAYTDVRHQVRAFLNAESVDEIIFTKGTTEAINLVAASFPLGEGDEVIISEMEHHANIVPWQLICQKKKAHLKVISVGDNGELRLEEFEKLLTPRTKIVAVAHISNVLGTINPISTIVKMAHRCGAKVFVDGAQSAPHIEIDVQQLGCDFFAFSGHKIYGPTGIGILYGKKAILEQMSPYQSGGDMIQTVTFAETTFQPAPLKFEAGTPMIAEVIGLGAALSYLLKHDLKKIAAYENRLIERAMQQLQLIEGLKILGPLNTRGALITFNIEGVHPLDLATLLDVKQIAVRSGHLCAQPVLRRFGYEGAVRLSVAPYNTPEEIDRFCNTVLEIKASLESNA